MGDGAHVEDRLAGLMVSKFRHDGLAAHFLDARRRTRDSSDRVKHAKPVRLVTKSLAASPSAAKVRLPSERPLILAL